MTEKPNFKKIAQQSQGFSDFRNRMHNPTERTMINHHSKSDKTKPMWMAAIGCESFAQFRAKLRER